MCFLCRCCDDPELCVDTLRTKLGDDGLSIPPEQKNALLEICNEIEAKILDCFLHWKLDLKFEDSKGGVLHKKYKEFETCVLQYDIIDWKQEEEKLRQFLLEYDNDENDELRFGINSMPWLKVFRTHERSIPEPIRKCLFEMCREIEELHYEWIDTYSNASETIIRRYQTLGHDVLEMEIVDWEDIRKSLKQILHDWNRELGFQGITVEDLDGKQHIIYHRLFFENDIDHLVNQVVDATGISKQEFVLVYGESLIVPGNKNVCIPDGAKIKLLPSNKELANQSIIVEDLDGQQHIINTNWVMYTKDVDYLVRQVAHTTGISERRFVLVYREKRIVPGNHFYIVLPNGAKIQLLPVKKIIDWKQEEEKVRQFLLEYDNAENDELRFGINSMPWLKVFLTHERSIPEPIRKCLFEMCKEIEELHYEWIDTYSNASEAIIRRYQTLGHDVLEMEIVDWEDIRKSLKQILHDWNRELGFQGITVEDLDGKQHIIYHRLFYENDIDHLVNQVVDATGISKQEFVLVYGESLIVPGNKNLCIPDGAKIKLLPSNKELANQSIIVEDLDGQQHIINTNWVMYTKDVDFLVRQVAHTTGISKRRFVLVYRDKLIVPGNHFYIVLPNGAKIQLLPVKENQKPPTNLTTYVIDLFKGIYEQIHRLFTKFPKVFEDHTRLLSEKDFVEISQLIGTGWGMLGIELGLSKVNLQQITEDKRNVASRIFEMLCQWGQTQKDGATAAQLLSAVRKSGVSCEFDKLQRALLIGM